MDSAPVLVPAIFDLSGWHILIILFIALLLFGRRLPEIMRGLGSSVKEFKKGMNEEDAKAAQPPPAQPPAAQPPQGAVARDQQPPAAPPKA
jgi:sec-independent protein translocase protein TatA